MDRKPYWFKLDNAAKIFPAVSDRELTSVFRISIHLKNPVKIAALQVALEKVYARFPYFNVHLKHGFFWHYLEEHKGIPQVEADTWPPMEAFQTKFVHDRLYRIRARGRQISLEMMHSVSDGGGGIQLLNSLLLAYFRELGDDISTPKYFMDINEAPKAHEFEDSYKKYFRKEIPPNKPRNKAWDLPFELKPKPRLSVIQAEISSSHILKTAKSFNVSVTEFLASVYTDTLQQIHIRMREKGIKQKLGIIRMQVPINLRRIFPSKSMRNFTLFALPEIDTRLGKYSFEEITQTVHHYMKLETYPKQIHRIISRNVGSEKLFYIRVIPLVIKDMVLAAKHKSYGNAQYSGVMTNLGQIKYPEEIAKYIDAVSCTPPPPNTRTKINCSIVSYENKMIASFCNITKSTELEQLFFKKLTSFGIPVKMLSWDDVLTKKTDASDDNNL
ncbi:MAG: hypothetical protein U9N51_10210 [Bacteroidota bacterium]|nr:hypothetical protein [Bacteroidota bacterium]